MGTGAGQIVTEADFDEIEQTSSGRPTWKLVQQAPQSIAHDTDVALQFGAGSTIIDTHVAHDEVTNNTRVTIVVPGIYVVMGIPSFDAQTNITRIDTMFAINGTIQAPRARLVKMRSSTGTTNDLVTDAQDQTGMQLTTIFELDEGDYVELMTRQARQAAAAANTNTGASIATVFEGYLLRS